VRRAAGIAIAFTVGATGIVAPILISVQLAWRQSVDYEKSRVLGYATDAVRRSDETGDQMESAYRQLAGSGLAPCSTKEIELMRRIDLGSSYLQAVGRMAGEKLICSSLGTTNPIPLGPATLVTETGAENRLNIRTPVSGDQPITIVSKGGFALLIAPNLPLDMATEGPDISLALFVPSSQSHTQVVASRGEIRPEWYRSIPKGSSVTFVHAGYVVSVARSAHGDIASVAAAPQTYVTRQVRGFATRFVPIGVLCGVALAWAVLFISRVQLALPSALRTAARKREFIIEYQPVVDLATRQWIGAEALVRWKHNGRMVQPDMFIPTAEESGVISLITRCVADIVTADLPSLIKIDPGFTVAINFSAADLRATTTLDLLRRILEISGARPENLMVEATEGGFLQGRETSQLIQRIRELGIGVAIDDFGTGYSSLSRLETMSPDVLKIDKSFVDTIGTSGAANQVVPHIIETGHSLRLKMMAEGVETEAQADFLGRRGVEYAQGWLFGKPMPVTELCALLASRRAPVPHPALSAGSRPK
jgi:sensor c-di-GMP phosphodiesterase-like protein